MQSFTTKQLNNLNEMFEYRKYKQTTFHLSSNDMLFFSKGIDDQLVCVKFIDIEKINVDNVRIFIAYLDKHDISHGIIICKNEPSIQVMKEILTLTIVFEIFYANQLNINISKHSLVPIHTLLSTEDAERVKKDYAVSFAKFPRIKYRDPMARYIGAEVGNLIKIEKPGQYITYRYVIRDKL